jgi:hypothetical protein
VPFWMRVVSGEQVWASEHSRVPARSVMLRLGALGAPPVRGQGPAHPVDRQDQSSDLLGPTVADTGHVFRSAPNATSQSSASPQP